MGMGMGMEKKTTAALQFALQFQQRKLPDDIVLDAFEKSKGNIEDAFPLNHVSESRGKERADLWEKAASLPVNEKTISNCKAALIVFLNLHLPYAFVIREILNESKSPGQFDEATVNNEIVKLRDFLPTVNFVFGKTRDLIEKEIKYRETVILVNKKIAHPSTGPYEFKHNIDGVIDFYRVFRRYTEAIDLRKTHLNVITEFNVITASLETLQQEQAINIECKHNPSDLAFRALEFVIFCSLWINSGKQGESAALTAQIVNEYAYHNVLLHDVCEERSEEDIKNLWKNSKYQDECLRGKQPPAIFKSC